MDADSPSTVATIARRRNGDNPLLYAGKASKKSAKKRKQAAEREINTGNHNLTLLYSISRPYTT